MKNKKRAGFKMKKTPTKFNAGVLAAAGQKLNRSSQMPMPNYTPNIGQKDQRLRTWDDYFDQDRFDSRAVNKRLSKSQRQYKIAQKKKAFEKRQAAALATAGMNPGGSFPGKPNFSDQMMGSLNQGVMGDGTKQGGMAPGTMGGTRSATTGSDFMNINTAPGEMFSNAEEIRRREAKTEAANQAFSEDPSEMFTKARATREREAKRKAAEQTWINSLKTGGGFYNVSPGGSSFTMKRGSKPNFKDLGSSKK